MKVLKSLNTEELKEFFETNDFIVHLTEQDNVQCAEVEKWTKGGVDMIIWLNPFTTEEFEKYVKEFDADEQVEFHRQDKSYAQSFSLQKGLDDFNAFHNHLVAVLASLYVDFKPKSTNEVMKELGIVTTTDDKGAKWLTYEGKTIPRPSAFKIEEVLLREFNIKL